MPRGRPSIGTPKVSIRVLLPRDDYEALKAIARAERTDVGALVRRALARSFFMAGSANSVPHNG